MPGVGRIVDISLLILVLLRLVVMVGMVRRLLRVLSILVVIGMWRWAHAPDFRSRVMIPLPRDLRLAIVLRCVLVAREIRLILCITHPFYSIVVNVLRCNLPNASTSGRACHAGAAHVFILVVLVAGYGCFSRWRRVEEVSHLWRRGTIWRSGFS